MSREDIAIDWAWTKDQLIRSEKIPSGKKSKSITEALKVCLKLARPLAKPKYASACKKILDNSRGEIRLEGGIRLSSKWLSSYLKGANSIHVFIVTVGRGIEETASRRMAGGEALEGYIIDRIGSFAVESLAQSFEESLRRHYGSGGFSVSMRFSPGYCDWAIEEQFELAKLVDFRKAGVTLTESCVMVPRKSITAVVGIGAKGAFRKVKSQCSLCGKSNCGYRRPV